MQIAFVEKGQLFVVRTCFRVSNKSNYIWPLSKHRSVGGVGGFGVWIMKYFSLDPMISNVTIYQGTNTVIVWVTVFFLKSFVEYTDQDGTLN